MIRPKLVNYILIALAGIVAGLTNLPADAQYTVGFEWQRSADYQGGVADNSTVNNPNLDSAGDPVWHYGWVNQLNATQQTPWYALPPTTMVWSVAWFGRPELARWQRSNEGSPYITRTLLAQANIFGSQQDFAPIMTWTNPTGEAVVVDVEAPSSHVAWTFLPSPGPIEVVVARRRSSTGETDQLLFRSIEKPTQDDSTQSASAPIHLPDIAVAPGDQILFAMRKGAALRFDENSLWDLADLTITLSSSDADGDGLTDDDEINIYLTDPDTPDTDGDGLLDGVEALDLCSDPLNPDTDGDTLNDGDEVNLTGTDPCNADTDGDGWSDDIDPEPTVPNDSQTWLEDQTRFIADIMSVLSLDEFNGPNHNANAGRRNALSNRLRSAANAIAAGDYEAAIDELAGVLAKMDGEGPEPDWIRVDSTSRLDLVDMIEEVIALLLLE